MIETIPAAVVLAGVASGNAVLWWLGIALLIILIFAARASALRARTERVPPPHIARAQGNPILGPIREHPWESHAVFNPAALCQNGRIHLLYRALGNDGVSRIGYASSADGIHFDERLPYPVFVPDVAAAAKFRNPFTSPARARGGLRYDPASFASGGGWGGSEDPRAVCIDNRVHMTYSAFNGWGSICMALASIDKDDFAQKCWAWTAPLTLSPAGQVHKNWVLFPEKIMGKFALLHSISPEIQIDYVDDIERPGACHHIKSKYHPHPKSRAKYWDSWVRGTGAPPIKTERGWLLFYHAMDPRDPNRYKVGAMLLDLREPTTVLYRSAAPVLEPDMPYENDWKPGVVYISGAVVKDGTLFLYYGGGDKTINVATAPLKTFLDELIRNEHAVLKPEV